MAQKVDRFGLGELSGAIKDILAFLQPTLQYSSFNVHVKQQEQVQRQRSDEAGQRGKEKAHAEEAIPSGERLQLFTISFFFEGTATIEMVGIFLLGLDLKMFDATLALSSSGGGGEDAEVCSPMSFPLDPSSVFLC